MFVCVCVYVEGQTSAAQQKAEDSVSEVTLHSTRSEAEASGKRWIREQRSGVKVTWGDPDTEEEIDSDWMRMPMSSFAVLEVPDPAPVFSGPHMAEFVRDAKRKRRHRKKLGERPKKNTKRKSIRSRRKGLAKF